MRNIVFSLVLVALAGCKVAVIVVEGGTAIFGDYTGSSETCEAGSVCFQDVPDTSVSLGFYAQPDDGWEFVRWNTGQDFLCGGVQNPLCELSLQPFAQIQAVEDIVASERAFYLMPVFQKIPATVMLNGREWYQPTFFAQTSWDEIAAVCPAGVCIGLLQGYDLTGWTWASTDDMNALFNTYIGSEQLGSGTDHYYEVDSSWAPAFFASGWRWTGGLPQFAHSVTGWTVSEASALNGLKSSVVDQDVGGLDRAHSDLQNSKDSTSPFDGAWFYRLAP